MVERLVAGFNDDRSRVVKTSSAAVCAQLLGNDDDFLSLRKHLTAAVAKAHSSNRFDDLVALIAGAAEFAPDFVFGTLKYVADIFPKVSGTLRSSIVRALGASCAKCGDLGQFVAHIRPFLLRAVNDDVGAAATAEGLRLAAAAAPQLTESERNQVLIYATNAASSPTAQVRAAAIDVLIWLFDNDAHGRDDGALRMALASFCDDADDSVRSKACSFWVSRDKLRFGAKLHDRICGMAAALDVADIDTRWLSIFTRVLMGGVVDADRALFTRPLRECAFATMVIDPNFSLPISSSLPLSISGSLSQGDIAVDDPSFAPRFVAATQAAGVSMTQTDFFTSLERITVTSESVEVDAPIAVGGRERFRPVAAAEAESFHARRMLKLDTAKRRAAEVEKEGRHKGVTVARTYRVGELPDIEIKASDVLNPLSSLLSRDDQVAKRLFVSLVRALNDSLPQASLNALSTIFEEMLSRQTSRAPDLAAALLEAATDCPQLRVAPLTVMQASLTVGHYRDGAVCLEAMIMRKVDSLPPSSRGSHSSKAAVADDVWAQLASLYSAMGQYDVVRGLTEKFSKLDFTKAALEAEVMGDYEGALRSYDLALDELKKREDTGNMWTGKDKPCDMEVS